MASTHNAAVQAAARHAIRAMRGQGMSQSDIAEHLGTSQATVSRWERGTSTPSKAYTNSLAEYAPGALTSELSAASPNFGPIEARLQLLEARIAELEAELKKKEEA